MDWNFSEAAFDIEYSSPNWNVEIKIGDTSFRHSGVDPKDAIEGVRDRAKEYFKRILKTQHQKALTEYIAKVQLIEQKEIDLKQIDYIASELLASFDEVEDLD